MTTLRETYAQQLYDALRQSPELLAKNAQFSRSLYAALDMRSTRIVVVVHHGADAPEERVVGMMDRHSEVLITVVVRDPEPDQVSESVLELVQPVVMDFVADGLIDVAELQTDSPAYDNAGGIVSARTVHYDLHYRTQRNSLSA
ncbi:hypothetical protein [Cupriavidus numazuensis]|uniref:Uncharacterized protein n=1 Tax=Cupriavidus numazuensis TaxID=221992 RepID=A0ABM8TAA9_9BURK|nr:hypothetical protein [Cupriavidus numazuensis]CAG2129145.1 hypothetical protein LMG26411_00125 [Cupriavidus numazuensis]